MRHLRTRKVSGMAKAAAVLTTSLSMGWPTVVHGTTLIDIDASGSLESVSATSLLQTNLTQSRTLDTVSSMSLLRDNLTQIPGPTAVAAECFIAKMHGTVAAEFPCELAACGKHSNCADELGLCCPDLSGTMQDCCNLELEMHIPAIDIPPAIVHVMSTKWPEASIQEVEWEIEHRDSNGQWTWNVEIEFYDPVESEVKELDILPSGAILELDKDDG
mmetsp:Transcript_59115/g.172954  ORF Transcript_59115/g.172954 Transcript_59115/m.172954 type:complete len:217 (+) Transcript_59115:58-708(+)